jgi:hypothetical protein
MIPTPNLKSASSSQPIPIRAKVGEAWQQFRLLWRERGPGRLFDFSRLERDFSEYTTIVREHAGFELGSRTTAFEIGCGQRPYRLLYFLARDIDAWGIDMDRVMHSLQDLVAILQANGFERAVKTGLRYALFDRRERLALEPYLSNLAGRPFMWPRDRVIHGNATDLSMWPTRPLDFILSEDVFEHIPRDQLPLVCKNCATRLSPRGIALIRPMIFTGIRGGHHVDWYSKHPGVSPQCPPWDHLRGNHYPVNTYLNRLSLADFRQLFSEYFDIVAEWAREPDDGREFMTPELRHELKDYPDEELYSNQVAFVLRRRVGRP